MDLDHLSFAAGPEGLEKTTRRLSEQLGTAFHDGGFHPRFGTQNNILPLAGGRYVEVVAVLDHPAADKAPFGQAVRSRSVDGGGWLGWVVAVDDLAPVEARLGRSAVDGHRYLPDGTKLSWRQIGVKGLQSDPQLPFFIKWVSERALRPSADGGHVQLTRLEIAGDRDRVDDWLGGQSDTILSDIEINWLDPDGQPRLVAATFATAQGPVRI